MEGLRLFLRSPAIWIVLLAILFVAMKVVNFVPILALVGILLMPVFLAGLMDGCRALDEGRELEVGHLIKGFQKNAGQLVTLGGVSLVGNLAILMLVITLGGEAITTLMKTLPKAQTLTPHVSEQMQAATVKAAHAVLVGAAVSLPLLMALWFSPLLVYFHGMKPLEALKSSFIACLRNVLPLFVYGLLILVAMMLLVPIGLRLGSYDLGLWLMAPALVPSIYASYKDIYGVGGPAAATQSRNP